MTQADTPLTALVTGSSRGIGAAIARALRARGVQVIGHATRALDPSTIAADLTDPTAPSAIWDEALDRAGGGSTCWSTTPGNSPPTRSRCPTSNGSTTGKMRCGST